MANSEGMFGGNGSVNWRVDVVNPIKIVSRKRPGRRGWRQTGHDAAPRDGRFTVTIQVPETGRDTFFAQFSDMAARSKRRTVTFTLPIEPGNRKQIRIVWPSGRGRRKAPSFKRGAAG